MKGKMHRKNKKGFTLVELVVVIAILGILAAIAIPTVVSIITTANESAEETDASALDEACKAYVAGVRSGAINSSNSGASTQADLPGPDASTSARLNSAKNGTVLNACEYSGLHSVMDHITNGHNLYVYDGQGNIFAECKRKDLTNYVSGTTTMQDLYNF